MSPQDFLSTAKLAVDLVQVLILARPKVPRSLLGRVGGVELGGREVPGGGPAWE